MRLSGVAAAFFISQKISLNFLVRKNMLHSTVEHVFVKKILSKNR